MNLVCVLLMTLMLLATSKPVADKAVQLADKTENGEDSTTQTDLESVKESESSHVKTAFPHDKETSKSGELEIEKESSNNEKKSEEDKKTLKTGLESESQPERVTAIIAEEKSRKGNLAKSVLNSKDEVVLSEKQVRSVTDINVALIAENTEEPRSDLDSNITGVDSVDPNSVNKETTKTINAALKSDNKDNKVERTGNANTSKKSQIESKTVPENVRNKDVIKVDDSGLATDSSHITKQHAITKQDSRANEPQIGYANSRSELHDSLIEDSNKLIETKSSISTNTVKTAVKDKTASLNSNSDKNIDNDHTTLQKRSENFSVENQDIAHKAGENINLKVEIVESNYDIMRTLTDNKDSNLKGDKTEPKIAVHAPTRRNNNENSYPLDSLQDKSGRPSFEFSDDEEFGNPKEAKPHETKPGYHRHITGVPVSAPNRLIDFRSAEGMQQLQNYRMFLQNYRPLAPRPVPLHFYTNPSIRIFRSPIQEIRKLTSEETILPNSPGFPPGFILPNRPSLPTSQSPPFEPLQNNFLSPNIPSPVTPGIIPIPKLKTRLLPQNQYDFIPKSGSFDNFDDYLNMDDENPRIDDYTSLDQNAYVFKNKKLNARPREGSLPKHLQEKLSAASDNPGVMHRHGTQFISSNRHAL